MTVSALIRYTSKEEFRGNTLNFPARVNIILVNEQFG
jgi:hypothetical protein